MRCSKEDIVTLEWHDRKTVTLLSGDCKLESTAMTLWPGVKESRTGRALRVGGMALLSLVKQKDTSQRWQSVFAEGQLVV